MSSVEMPNNPQFKNLTGMKFGRFIIVSYAGKRGRQPYWNCMCECGTSKTVHGGHLKEGRSRSCGCLNSETQRISFEKHGGASLIKAQRHPLYSTWCGMKKRCYNKNSDQRWPVGVNQMGK